MIELTLNYVTCCYSTLYSM